ncbi:hemolysin XhlA family protein [Acetoanaerobium noterae]|uniref:hemolysin XhlA family protein n=1 Tax=Acetoanaerobium noterae TaxID=745369 RepID=UPI003241DCB4
MIEEKLCIEKHKTVGDKLKAHEKLISDHDKRIDIIEQNASRMDERLLGLITQLGALNTILKWFIGLIVGGFVSFFFYAAQKGLL